MNSQTQCCYLPPIQISILAWSGWRPLALPSCIIVRQLSPRGKEFTRGSCRSIPEFHITEALDQCADLLHHYGGHAAAAGFTLYTHLLPEFIHRLQQITAQQIGSMDLRPVLEIDADLSFTDLRADLLHALNVLQPTGMGNRSALFLTRNALVKYQRAIGKDNAHLKLILEDAQRVSRLTRLHFDWVTLPGTCRTALI